MPVLTRTMKSLFTAAILTVFIGLATTASAENKKPAQASSPKPAAQASRPTAQAARPAGNSGGGVQRPSSTSGPSANRPTFNNPSANRGQQLQRPGGFSSPGSHSSPFRASAPRGSNERSTAYGSVVRTRPNGRISDVHDSRRGIDVHRGLNGNRAVSLMRADHSRVFAERGRPGFVQHPYSFHGQDFARRTYFYHGRAYSHLYHGFSFRGLLLNVYAPGFYYHPGFYGWAYNPWARPITFGWGWRNAAWYGYYGGYFQPYPSYPSASYWLTDYLISQDLQTAYAAHQEAGEVDGAAMAAGGPPALTPDVKQQVADEVRNQLALENQEAQQNTQQQDVDPGSSGIARLVSDGRPHVFVVGSALDVVDNSGVECSLSDGDVLALRASPPSDASAADLAVLSSKGGSECQKSATVSVSLDDLQEMQNHMRETIDQGLEELQAKQGKDGLPTLPPSAQSAPAPALYASVAPPPDPNAASDIQQQTQQADQTESEATGGNGAAVSAPPAAPEAPPAPASVQLGETADQVQGALGAPTRVANLGAKIIYYYNGMKVTFKDGKVSNVQ